jgi:hypothetical protein
MTTSRRRDATAISERLHWASTPAGEVLIAWDVPHGPVGHQQVRLYRLSARQFCLVTHGRAVHGMPEAVRRVTCYELDRDGACWWYRQLRMQIVPEDIAFATSAQPSG